MTEAVDICSLEYLVGTLATAYKGLITSLIAKDFCMTEADERVTLKGMILAMPEGDYQAFLMKDGIELARGTLRQGFFELQTDSIQIKSTRNLQIDIVQSGRHIGTFLLKQERADGMFQSALELSEDIKGINFQRLTVALREKPGLLKKAEQIIAKILSTKKDWGKLSEKINSFAKDLFWSDRELFYLWYVLLVRYALRASENSEKSAGRKPVFNLLSLVELPLENEDDERKLHAAADAWLHALKGSSISFSRAFPQVGRIASAILARFPAADVGAVLRQLLQSLKELAVQSPAIRDATLDALRESVTAEGFSRLSSYGEDMKQGFLKHMDALETLLNKGRYADLLREIEATDFSFSDDTEMTNAFFDVIEKNIREENSAVLVGALSDFFLLFGSLSPDAYRRGVLNTAGMIRHLVRSGLTTSCASLLGNIAAAGLRVKEDVLLNREIASSVLDGGSTALVQQYTNFLKQIVVPRPVVSGFSPDTWAEIVPRHHLQRLGEFLAIISQDRIRFKDLLIHLICNLSVSGVFIPDDRLFQREISSYLNAGGLQKDFLLHYLLLKKFPVFFNEVGASGKIRDFTTEIDAWGNDTVLYFLRKQVHVNASNYNIGLVEKILRAWLEQDTGILRGALPDEILNRFDLSLLKRYSSALRSFFESLKVWEGGELHLGRLSALSGTELREALKKIEADDEILKKIFLLSRIYQEIVKKYSVTISDYTSAPAGREVLCPKLGREIDRMKSLRAIVLSAERTAPQESLYFKRHIAFGIPSVMGSYHEPKFDAFAGMISAGESIRVLIEQGILALENRSANFSDDDMRGWICCLERIQDLFKISGLDNFQTEEIITVLRTNRLFLSQIIDLLRIWQRELAGMVESLSNTFYKPFTEVLAFFPGEDVSENTISGTQGVIASRNRTTDVYVRDIMHSVPGFIELDRLLGDLVSFLSVEVAAGRDKVFSPHVAARQERDFFVLDALPAADALVLSPALGGKAAHLALLNQAGLPVPCGVVFTAEKTDTYQKYTGDEGFMQVLKSAVRNIEDRTGTGYGDPANPLFLSVRSGSYISMPGILSTILFCGINRETLNGFIGREGDAWLAYDSYRRFIEHFSVVVYGLDARLFDDIRASYLDRQKRGNVKELFAGEMETLTGLYLEALKERDLVIPDDAYEQLQMSVRSIYGSWYAERAVQFRKAMHVSGHWGTSVLIMQMICGNGRNSGASVFFTRRPVSMEREIYGDTRENATGADLVDGRLINRPLSRKQVTRDQKSLEETDPELFAKHQDLAVKIEEAMDGLPQEVEATYTIGTDGERLIYVLQTKRMEIHRGFTKRFQDVCKMQSKVIGRGVGVHGGALSGVAAFSSRPEDILKLREESGMPVIVLRAMASTSDVSLMPEVDGIITVTGGVSSHASILAQKFDLTAVVGCTDMHFSADEKGRSFATIGRALVKEGTLISLDGSTGLIYSGSCESMYEE